MTRILLHFLFVFLFLSRSVQAQIIHTIAGNGNGGYGGDNGQATAAMLFNPGALALATNGDLLIADMSNGCIRRVDKSTHIITTFPGSTGLNNPLGVTMDAAGNLYVSEWTAHRVKKITPAGVGSIIAGTGSSGYNGDNIPATTAQLNNPMEVVVSRTTNQLYIADAVNNRVRKVDLSTGQITTVAGTGTYGYNGDGMAATLADLAQPSALTVDSTGNLILLDKDNARIRRVDAATGIITTVMGTGVSGYSGNGGVATAATMSWQCYGVAVNAEGDIWFSDMDHSVVRRIDHLTGIVNAVAGNTIMGYAGDGGPALQAKLNAPRGIIVQQASDVTFADEMNERIRQFDENSTTALAELTTHGTFQVMELPSGELQCSGCGPNSRVECIDVSGKIVATALSNACGQVVFPCSSFATGLIIFREASGKTSRHLMGIGQ